MTEDADGLCMHCGLSYSTGWHRGQRAQKGGTFMNCFDASTHHRTIENAETKRYRVGEEPLTYAELVTRLVREEQRRERAESELHAARRDLVRLKIEVTTLRRILEQGQGQD